MNMLHRKSENQNNSKIQITSLFGLILIVAGVLLILDMHFKTKWLTISIPGILGLILIFFSIFSNKKGWLIAGTLLTGIGLGVFFALQQYHTIPLITKFGYLFMFFAISCMIIFVILQLLFQTIPWWALICAAVFGAVAYSLLFSPLKIFVFVLSISLALGLVFILWGIYSKRLGLIIPGSLLVSIGPGISTAWSNVSAPKGLVETGVMLVWFSLGWILITVFSRIIHNKFIWWPLIPGGILAMVGWGLYIGGNPGSALGFIGNSGSIALIIFGIYLLLLRFGIQK